MLVSWVAGGGRCGLVRRWCGVEPYGTGATTVGASVFNTGSGSTARLHLHHEHRSTRTTCDYLATAIYRPSSATTPPANPPSPWPAPVQRLLSLPVRRLQGCPSSSFAQPRPDSPCRYWTWSREPMSSKLCPRSIQSLRSRQSWTTGTMPSRRLWTTRWRHTKPSLERRPRHLCRGRLRA